MLRVTPIYGSHHDGEGSSSNAPRCSLVEYGGVRCLWNVGLPPIPSSDKSTTATATREEEKDEKQQQQQQQQEEFSSFSSLPDHDVLIISDSTLASLGGLPLYYKEYPHVPMYATFPTVKMGQMTLYDYHASVCLDGKTPPFSLEELDQSTAALQTIKYSQTIPIRPTHTTENTNNNPSDAPLLSITAQRAGHVIGGAFYILQRVQDETVVVLTSTYHIARELHLDSSTLLKHGATPDVLVTYPGGPAMGLFHQLYSNSSSNNNKPRFKQPVVAQAEKNLVETVLSVLRRDGHVLLPVDASGRVMELLILLSQQWEKQRLAQTYNLCWLGPMVQNTLEFARSQLEWMAAPLGAQFDSQRGHPLSFKNRSDGSTSTLRVCTNLPELEAVMAENGNPTVVLASGASLDAGPARDLLLKWADNPDNAIVFTDSSRCTVRDATITTATATTASASTAPATANTTAAANTNSGAGTNTTAAATPAPSDNTAAAAAATTAGAVDMTQEEDMVGSAVQQVSKFTTAYQLLSHWANAKLQGQEMADVVVVDVLVRHRVPLKGAELKAFQTKEDATRKAQKEAEERRAMLREVESAKANLRLGEEEQAKKTAAPKTVFKYQRPKKKSRFDSSLFLKFSKPLHLTFEVREEAVGIGQDDSTARFGIGESVGRSDVMEDEYGIPVIAERFTDIVTGVDPSKFSSGTGRIGEEVSRRGFGFGADGRPVMPNTGGGGPAGRVAGSGEPGQGENAIIDEQALEAEDLSEGKGIIRGRNGRPPSRVSTVPRKIEVLAEVAYIPLEGRVDARSARQSVRALQPRQVVVLGGRASESSTMVDEVSLLADSIKSYLPDGAQTPSNGETAELEVGHAAYSVRLIDTPYLTPAEKEEATEDPVPSELNEMQVGECTVARFDYVALGLQTRSDASHVLAPRPTTFRRAKTEPSIYVSDGDVLLTDLRAELIAQGMKSDYSAQGGYSKLVINGKIIVKKEQETGKIELEGPLCEDFFSVRSIVNGQFITL